MKKAILSLENKCILEDSVHLLNSDSKCVCIFVCVTESKLRREIYLQKYNILKKWEVV